MSKNHLWGYFWSPCTQNSPDLDPEGDGAGPAPAAAPCVGPVPEPRVAAAVCPLCPELWDQSLSIHTWMVLQYMYELFAVENHVSHSKFKKKKILPFRN